MSFICTVYIYTIVHIHVCLCTCIYTLGGGGGGGGIRCTYIPTYLSEALRNALCFFRAAVISCSYLSDTL